MILTEKEVVIIPSLAVVGAASIIGAAGYGLYKLGKSVYVKTAKKNKKFNSEVDKRVKEYYETL